MSGKPGLTVGAFELSGRLGRGGMGEVWRARHTATGIDAAIKVITADFARDPDFQEGFHREVQAMAMLEHPSIVRVFDYGEIDRAAAAASAAFASRDKGTGTSAGTTADTIIDPTGPFADAFSGELIAGSPFVALELANAGTLSHTTGNLDSWEELRAILLALLDALAHSHARGLIHRDLKPDNVLVFDDDLGRQYKLTDFGIAHSLDAETGEGENEISGTPHYMAPEQFMGTWRSLGPSTDLYALGCMAYQLVTGRLPFDARSPMQVGLLHISSQPDALEPRFDVPKGFASWVATLMSKEPHQRYHKAADAAWALVRLEEPTRRAARQQPPGPAQSPGGLESLGTAPTLDSQPIEFSFGPTLGVTAGQLDSAVLRQLARSESIAGGSVDANSGDAAVPAPAPGHPDTPTQALAPVPKGWESHARRVRTAQPLSAMSPRLYGLRAIPLVGRREQRDKLWKVLRETHQQSMPRLVVVEGPSGCGKSRLARWLTERADELGAAEVMQAVHSAKGGRGEGLQGMLERWFRSTGLAGERLKDRVCERLGMASGERAWMVDALCRFLGAEPAIGGIDKRDSFPALAALFEHVARRRALVIWLDDLQWGEEAVQFLEFVLMAESYAMPVVFVATIQGEAMAERALLAERIDAMIAASETNDGGSLRLQLGALSRAENRALIGELLHLDDALVARIERRVDGNPLFAVQLVGDWVERGWLVADAHGFRLADGVTPELPDDLHAVWAGRIERLLEDRPQDDAAALELAAVLGREVDFVEWDAICGQEGVDASRALVHLMVDQRLARVDDSGWAFIHGMLCQSLVRIMRAEGRWQLRNATAADALDELRSGQEGEGRVAELNGRIGRHRFYAGAYESAIAPLLDGATHLLERGDTVAALELLEVRDRAVEQLAGHEQTEHSDGRARLDGLMVRVSIYNSLKRLDEARALAEQVHEEAGDAGWHDLVARALLLICRTEHLIGRTDSAADFAHQALNIFEALGDSEGKMLARLRLGDHGSYIGDSERAIEHYRAALESAETLGDVRSAAWSQWGIGYALQQLMRFDAAREPLERSYQLNLDAGTALGAAAVLSSLADSDRWTGDLERAEARYLEVWRAHTDRGLACPACALNIASLYAQWDRFDEARQWVDRGEAQARREQTRLWTSAHCLRLVLAAQRSDWTRFDDHLSELRAGFAESSHIDPNRASLLEQAGDYAHGDGEEERARSVYELALGIWRQLDLDDPIARVERALDALRETSTR